MNIPALVGSYFGVPNVEETLPLLFILWFLSVGITAIATNARPMWAFWSGFVGVTPSLAGVFIIIFGGLIQDQSYEDHALWLFMLLLFTINIFAALGIMAAHRKDTEERVY